LHKEIAKVLPIAKAIAALFHPYVEVIVHDFEENKMAASFNHFSKKEAGRPNVDSDSFDPEFTVTEGGRRLKTTRALIRDDAGNPVGLFTINFDLSKMDELKLVIDAFTSSSLPLTQDLFKDDWKERINVYVQEFASTRHLTPSNLSREEKRDLIARLYAEGAFKAKKAADHVAKVLGLSRATVYKHLPKTRIATL